MSPEQIIETSAPRYAHVVLPIPVDQSFTYEIPADLRGRVRVGYRVEVPFGRRVLNGVVVELAETTDLARTRPIAGLQETFAPPDLLELANWIASYYGCSRGEAMQAVIPPSLKRAKVKPRPTGLLRVTDDALRAGGEGSEAYAAAQKKLSRAKKQLALLTELLSAGGEAPVPAILSEWGYAREVIDGLEKRGVVRIDPIARTSPLDSLETTVETLTPAQQNALARITADIDAREFRPSLLYGVTGSGKTEVYLRAARAVLERGGSCIVLVPEIGLLPQATARYRRALGDTVAIIHSRLTGPERFDIWERIERGEHRVIVGPRSAVFSPARDLRLIIVDEEQDESYKQDDKPRYHARSVAMLRGREEKLAVALGSATPSAESLRLAREERYKLLRLPDRVSGGALPGIEIVDMRDDDARGKVFSPRLIERLDETIKSGHQAIVFLNKRGHARYVQCGACGWLGMCINCDITLTFHRVDDRMKCHLCGYERGVPARCDKCNSRLLNYTGVGTQRVELDLKSLFPGVGVLRMDADTTSGKDGHRKILEEFSTGQYPILLGTQMVTKGHHFPGVALVGVVSAEEGLNFPDFRSAERTFQQLTQVAGRAGRSGAGGVVIQTYSPDHAVFRYLTAHDYDGFMSEELEVRRALNYPPYARMVLASCSGPDAMALNALMEEWALAARALLGARGVAVLGPTPPLVPRVKNRFREHMLLKGPIRQADKDAVLAAFQRLTAKRRGASAIDLRWDVDPESFF
ncbi:MAG TPA: primosomal protein N' [Candidatus Krumholzibacteria bacterium]|nr:primosomal protein N' [Candidatus Krumholzibacteria bacterium]